MQPTPNRIYLLDNVSQSKIRSSTRISCLNEIVVELVKNALDAKAKSISIVLNYAIGFCSVEDDGCGISVQEFADNGRLAENYCTSKAEGPPSLYGRYGRHLAAISGIALLSVSSRQEDQRVHTLWVNDTGRLGHHVGEEDDWHALRGTRVRVYNLFARFPVRRKHLAHHFASTHATERELDRLKYDLAGLMFAYPGIFDLDLRHTKSCSILRRKCVALSTEVPETQPTYRDSKTICAVLQQLRYIDRSQVLDWQYMNVSAQTINIQAAVSSIPCPHKLVQFISVNQYPLKKQTHSTLFDVINSAFDLSTFGAPLPDRDTANELQAVDESGYIQSKQITEHKKGIDKWPMFIIWVDTKDRDIHAFCDDTASAQTSEKFMSRISALLKTMVTEFLKNNGHTIVGRAQQTIEHTPDNSISYQSTPSVRRPNPSLGNWSRIKSSNGIAMDDILSGLPFQASKDGQEEMSSRDAHIQEPGHPINLELPLRLGNSTDCASKEIIEWADPQTGKTSFIDPRTGTVLPQTAHSSLHGQDFAHGRKRQKVKSFAQVAQNVRKQWGLRNDNEKPIRSIDSFPGPAQSLDSSGQTDNKIAKQFGQSSSTHNLQIARFSVPKISKTALKDLAVLGQVDQKFILGVVPCVRPNPSHTLMTDHQLVLIDQHAADERVKVEQLIRSFFDETITLASPIAFETSAGEAKLLEYYKSYFGFFHIIYNIAISHQDPPVNDIAGAQAFRASITELPEVIAERCRLQPKIIIDLLREEVWSDVENVLSSNPNRAKPCKHHDPPEQGHTKDCDIAIASNLPSRVLDLLNSRACRSAIMFNDELTQSQCARLVRSLAECTLPFQCAHGRPSLVTLTELSSFPAHDPLATKEGNLYDLGPAPSETTHLHPRGHGLNSSEDEQSFGYAYINWIKNRNTDIESVAE